MGEPQSFDALLDLENQFIESGYNEGLQKGQDAGIKEGHRLGLLKGFELGEEVGFYYGNLAIWAASFDAQDEQNARMRKTIDELLERIPQFVRIEPRDQALHDVLEKIRAKFKQVKSNVDRTPKRTSAAQDQEVGFSNIKGPP
mmetsp:Transcript_19176/g.31390  ORF Transcript_19176/g.31390 Transcript_19176/m.31390 type:complete len:143 (+) Transcript_19176:73-501(+)